MSSKVVNIEYHAVCPACGAANGGGSETCEYCGANLIKNKSVENFAGVSDEEQYMVEDLGLPEEYGKSCDVNRTMTAFWLLFGGLFFLIPTVIFLGFCMTGQIRIFVVLYLSIFWAIGLGVLIPVYLGFRNRKRCRNGQIVSGIVRGYEESSIMVNNRPMLNLRVRIEDERGGRILIVSTGDTKRKYPQGMPIKFLNYGKYYMIYSEEQ